MHANFLRSRRRFVASAALGVAGGLLPAGRVLAAELPALAESEAMAVALGYRADAKSVDAKKFPQHKNGQTCAGCRFFQGSAATGPCSLFPGTAVAAAGWCSAFNAKA